MTDGGVVDPGLHVEPQQRSDRASPLTSYPETDGPSVRRGRYGWCLRIVKRVTVEKEKHVGEDEHGGRRPRADVVRNRASILTTAQRHFLAHGVGTSLEAVAKEAGVGPATLYRHFPTREALLAGVLQLRSRELIERQGQIAALADPDEALQQWMRALEDYFSTYSGLPEPLMKAARERQPGNPLTLPCEMLIRTTEDRVVAAQRHGSVESWVKGYDLFLAANSMAWIKSTGAGDETSLPALRRIIETGYRRS
jgi:AcrR family transcriptional regulator